jgi:hypothetical protein
VGWAEGEEEGGGFVDPLGGGLVGGGGGAEAGFEHVGVDDAGVEGHGGEAGWEFLGEGGGEAFDGEFGGAVGGDLRRGGAAPAGAEVDDDARAPRDHGGEEVADGIDRAFDVDIDHRVGFVGREVPEGGVARDGGGVVEEEVGCGACDGARPG